MLIGRGVWMGEAVTLIASKRSANRVAKERDRCIDDKETLLRRCGGKDLVTAGKYPGLNDAETALIALKVARLSGRQPDPT